MNWLYEKKMREGGNSKRSAGAAAEAPPGAGGEPDAWNSIEQGSKSGFSYSGLDVDTSSTGDGGMTMPGAFSFLNGSAGPGDRSQNAGGFSNGNNIGTKKSKKEELFDKQMEAYQRERDNGMPRLQQRM